MTPPIAESSSRFQAGMAGLIALITTNGVLAIFVRSRLIVFGDAAATAHNIQAHELLFRLGFVGDLLALLYIAYTLVLYNLFKHVSRNLSLLAASFSLGGCAVGAANCLSQIVPPVVLGNARSLSAFAAEQLHGPALLLRKLHAQGYAISMVLFGSYNLLVGYLIFRSTFLPRILCLLLAISGLCYLINCFSIFLAPDLAPHPLPYILLPGASELLLAVWILGGGGVNVQRWCAQASAA